MSDISAFVFFKYSQLLISYTEKSGEEFYPCIFFSTEKRGRNRNTQKACVMITHTAGMK